MGDLAEEKLLLSESTSNYHTAVFEPKTMLMMCLIPVSLISDLGVLRRPSARSAQSFDDRHTAKRRVDRSDRAREE